MTTPPMFGSSPAPATPLIHERQLATQSSVCASIAVVLGLVWGPIMWIIAFVLRPPHLSSPDYNPRELASLQHDAALQLWIILIASFLLALALAMFAIILGRRTVRFAGSERLAARLGWWGGVSLVISLLSLGCLLLEYYAPAIFHSNGSYGFVPYIVIQLSFVLFIALAVAGALSSFVLNGIAARTSARARIGLVVSALLVLVWFLFVALFAQVIVAVHVHLVY